MDMVSPDDSVSFTLPSSIQRSRGEGKSFLKLRNLELIGHRTARALNLAKPLPLFFLQRRSVRKIGAGDRCPASCVARKCQKRVSAASERPNQWAREALEGHDPRPIENILQSKRRLQTQSTADDRIRIDEVPLKTILTVGAATRRHSESVLINECKRVAPFQITTGTRKDFIMVAFRERKGLISVSGPAQPDSSQSPYRHWERNAGHESNHDGRPSSHGFRTPLNRSDADLRYPFRRNG